MEMEAAARSSSQVGRRAKRPRSSSTAAAVGIEAAGSAAALRRAKSKRRGRAAQIGIPPSRRAKTVQQQHLAVSKSHPHSNWVCWGGRRPRSTSPRSSSSCLTDDSISPKPCPTRGDEKRARTWRDWSDLGDGPAGLIADRVLAYDVADYVRFRAVCRPWRQSSPDPRTSTSGLDRRFHPWRWTMLREELAVPHRRCFLNTSTARCVQVHIPELHDNELLAHTPEGLLVLAHKQQRATIRLLNPLTRKLTDLPPLTTLLPSKDQHKLFGRNGNFNAGIANDDSTVVICFNRLGVIGMAKPGDDSWTLLKYGGYGAAALMFTGRFCFVNHRDVMVLEMGAHQPPHLEVAAKLTMCVSAIGDSLHLLNNCGELILVHRTAGRQKARNKSGRIYDAYRVDLETGTLVPVKSLGGNAVFMGLRCSLSVPPEVFPSGTISADTIYPSFDFNERSIMLATGAYRLADGRVEPPCSSVQQPHTLIDCLSLANSVKAC